MQDLSTLTPEQREGYIMATADVYTAAHDAASARDLLANLAHPWTRNPIVDALSMYRGQAAIVADFEAMARLCTQYGLSRRAYWCTEKQANAAAGIWTPNIQDAWTAAAYEIIEMYRGDPTQHDAERARVNALSEKLAAHLQ